MEVLLTNVLTVHMGNSFMELLVLSLVLSITSTTILVEPAKFAPLLVLRVLRLPANQILVLVYHAYTI